jgi:hypothetical protein
MKPWPLLIVLLACALPVAAVALLRDRDRAGGPAAPPAIATSPTGGLVFRDRERVLRPNLLQDSYSVELPYANASLQPLSIAGAVTSCGCAGIEFRPRVLAPGAWGAALVTVAGKGRFGSIDASVQVRHDRGEPASFTVRLEMPPAPRMAGELVIPAGMTEASLAIQGGSPALPLRLLATPTSSRPGIAVRVEPDGHGLRLVCAAGAEARPAAGRITVRVGYDQRWSVEHVVRVLAE